LIDLLGAVMTAGWTEDRVNLLTKLWGDGLSASQIAKQLTGVTRNAVIGKVHRLGLAGRAAPSRPVKTTLSAAPKPRPVVAPVVRLVTPVERPAPVVAPVVSAPVAKQRSTTGVSVLALREGMCKWPMGDPGDQDFAFCGCSIKLGTPYCTDHAAIAYQPAAPRRKVTPEDRARIEAQRWQRTAVR
jgi:GcrA cell cycle regulator